MTRQFVRLASIPQGQAAAYEQAMGRSWDSTDPEPNPCDYGAPQRPALHEPLITADGYVTERNAHEWDAFYAAHDEWFDGPQHDIYREAFGSYYERREQFDWSPRLKNAAQVLQACQIIREEALSCSLIS